MKYIHNWLINTFSNTGMQLDTANTLSVISSLIFLIFLIFFIQIIVKKIIRATVVKLFKKTKTSWDDFLINRKVFAALAHLPAAIFLTYTYNFSGSEIITTIIYKISQLYYVFLFALTFARTLMAINDMYQTTEYSKNRSIKGYIQLIQIFIYFIATIITISILSEKDLTGVLTGLSAMAAVLMLIFKDSILGFVASIQLSANDMLKPGDWITMPSHNADGTVIDISLNTIKVQNWDKTITTIPAYSLVADSFSNWTGMEKSGGRRIKRSVNIDMTSIRFCDDTLLNKLSKFHILKDYVIEKQKEIEEYNKELNIESGHIFNGRRQTNIGIFRYYLEAYLKQNPNINDEMTFLVRQLQPTEKGLPMEIYVFSRDQRWAYYEAIQADIFDHILSILPEFGLRVYQSPTGYDLTRIK